MVTIPPMQAAQIFAVGGVAGTEQDDPHRATIVPAATVPIPSVVATHATVPPDCATGLMQEQVTVHS
ncbi:hypothetical protein GCM10010529_27290 [Nesterenkonia aethiopica]|uniref:Uncharacterized protein n=1 Tax=Nesterenkonia aethiopica TaxID=269144 RepID=A0ABP6M6D4_9MICC